MVSPDNPWSVNNRCMSTDFIFIPKKPQRRARRLEVLVSGIEMARLDALAAYWGVSRSDAARQAFDMVIDGLWGAILAAEEDHDD